MGYTITVNIRKAKDPRDINNLLTKVVEHATGQEVRIVSHDNRVQVAQEQHKIQRTQRKLLK